MSSRKRSFAHCTQRDHAKKVIGWGNGQRLEAAMKRVLIVEDEAPLRELWVEALCEGGYDAVAAESADDAFARLAETLPRLVAVASGP